MSDVKEQNKRKQQFLNLNGIKVKIDVDGSRRLYK